MKYKSNILEVIHKSAVDKYEIGAISKARMQEYDKMCLAEENKISKNLSQIANNEFGSPVPSP